MVGHNDVFVILSLFEVVGRDGSEISGEAREEVMAMGKEAFVQVEKKNKMVLIFMYNFLFLVTKIFLVGLSYLLSTYFLKKIIIDIFAVGKIGTCRH